jgi:hypothetical protein
MECGRKAKRAARCDDAEARATLASASCWLIVFDLIDQATRRVRIVRIKQYRCMLER